MLLIKEKISVTVSDLFSDGWMMGGLMEWTFDISFPKGVRQTKLANEMGVLLGAI
jgi:hypothetical protein